MTKTNEARCAGRQRMDAGELAPWVAEFTRRLRQQGYTSLTVKSYDDAARHHAHWLLKAKVAVAAPPRRRGVERWYFNEKFKLSGACRWCRGGALVS